MNRLSNTLIIISSLLISLNSFAEGPKRKLYIYGPESGNGLVPEVIGFLKEAKIDNSFEISHLGPKQLKDHPLGDKDQMLIVLGGRWSFIGTHEYVTEKNWSQVSWYPAVGSNGCRTLKERSFGRTDADNALFEKYPNMNCFESAKKGYIPYLVQLLQHETPQVPVTTEAKPSPEPVMSEPWTDQLTHDATKWDEKMRKDFIAHFLQGTSLENQKLWQALLIELSHLKHNSLKNLLEFLKSEREDRTCPSH